MAEIGMTIAAPGRRSYGDEDDVGFRYGTGPDRSENARRPAWTLLETMSASPGS